MVGQISFCIWYTEESASFASIQVEVMSDASCQVIKTTLQVSSNRFFLRLTRDIETLFQGCQVTLSIQLCQSVGRFRRDEINSGDGSTFDREKEQSIGWQVSCSNIKCNDKMNL